MNQRQSLSKNAHKYQMKMILVCDSIALRCQQCLDQLISLQTGIDKKNTYSFCRFFQILKTNCTLIKTDFLIIQSVFIFWGDTLYLHVYLVIRDVGLDY